MARFITRKEAEGRKFRLRVFAGMFDFLATIGSLILIFACVALLASLVTWIRNDAGNATAPALTAGAFFLKKGEGACAFPGVPCSPMCAPVKNARSAGEE